jgi:hypothetical protein
MPPGISKTSPGELVIDLRESSKMQWIKVTDGLGPLMRHFVKKGWFFMYRQRLGENFLIISSGVDLEKDVPLNGTIVWEVQGD